MKKLLVLIFGIAIGLVGILATHIVLVHAESEAKILACICKNLEIKQTGPLSVWAKASVTLGDGESARIYWGDGKDESVTDGIAVIHIYQNFGEYNIKVAVFHSDGSENTENSCKGSQSLPTPTPTFTPSVTLTPSQTPTSTPTFTPTSTGTATKTLTPSATPTATPTSTPTFTFTPSSTPTNTLTASPGPSLTPSQTLTNSPTPTASNTPTVGPSLTPSSTVTPSSTPKKGSPTATPTEFAPPDTGVGGKPGEAIMVILAILASILAIGFYFIRR